MTTQHQLMRILRGLLVFAVLMPVCSAGAAAGEPNAAELVRAVRESENWIHKVDSFELRVESIWTTPPQPAQSETENTSASSRMGRPYPSDTEDFVEFAFNSKRVRYQCGGEGMYKILRIWDGEKTIAHEQSPKTNKEDYYILAEKGRSFETMFATISWLRSQPHSFWFCPKDVNERMKYYGYPEDFILKGRRNFRGIDCFVLDWKPAKGLYAASDLSRRWYVGVKDKRLYGLATLRGDQTDGEHHTLDYREIAPGCWFPMKQGYKIYEPDSEGKYRLRTRRDMEMVKVRINEELPEEMFQIQLKEGVEVTDNRSGQRISYIYKAPLTGKVFPSLNGISIDFDRKKASDNLILFCFFDSEQRPSRHCLRQLNKMSRALKVENVVVLTVHASKIEREKLDDWIKENDINLTVGSISGEVEQIRWSWGVKSLPWLILTDQKHIVTSNGFMVNELNEKIRQAKNVER